MRTEDKDYLMDSFAKYADEHVDYDNYYINLSSLEKIVEDFIKNKTIPHIKQQIINEIIKHVEGNEYFSEIGNEDGKILTLEIIKDLRNLPISIIN